MSRAKLFARRLVAHRVAAVFHHDDLLVVLLHVRQRLDEDAGLVLGRNGHLAVPVFVRPLLAGEGQGKRRGVIRTPEADPGRRACSIARRRV